MRIGKEDDAAENFETAITLNPKEDNYYNNLGKYNEFPLKFNYY